MKNLLLFLFLKIRKLWTNKPLRRLNKIANRKQRY